MSKKRRKKRKKRGYPVAILIGFKHKKAVLWEIFSEKINPLSVIRLKKEGENLAYNELYNFQEKIIDAIRPYLKEGLRSVIIIHPRSSSFSESFTDHIQKHHKWLSQEKSSNHLTIGVLEGSASNAEEVSELSQTEDFKQIIRETTSEEAQNLIEELEERLQLADTGELVLYSLRAIEELTYGQWKPGNRKPEFVILTNTFLETHKQKHRIHRLLQILKNKKVKTKIIDADSVAGERVIQFGGLICFTKTI